MSSKLEKDRRKGSSNNTDGRQCLVSTSSRKFIIVPGTLSNTHVPAGSVGSGNSLGTVDTCPALNDDSNSGHMGRSLQFHSMRSVRGE